MSIIKKGTLFGATEQVTSDKLNNLVDNASFTDTSANAVAYTGSTGTCLNGGGLEVTSAGQLQIEDDGVTIAKTSFIGDTTATMTLSGTAPRIILDDTDNSGESPEVNGNSVDGNLSILAEKSGADITIDADDEVILKHNGTEGLKVAADAGKDSSGAASAGAKVSGNLQVTGDINCAGGFNDIVLKSSSPKITFEETDVTISDPYVQSFNSGNIEIKTEEADSLIRLDGKNGIVVEYDGSNTLMEVGPTAATDSGGNGNQRGIKVTNDIYALGDIVADGTAKAAVIKIGNDNILDLMHPVGSVISTTTNYADSAAVVAAYGGTTWVRFAEGEVLVGHSTTDSDFNAATPSTGGAKTHTLTTSEIPAHTHTVTSGNSSNSQGSVPFESGSTADNSYDTNSTGGGSAHNNLQPYIAVYMWKRTV